MKKMVCEICESQKIKKENGVFICQDCGTEYSLEEAKKLLIDIETDSLTNTSTFSNEKTNVIGKEELINALQLWIANLSKFQDMKMWFNLSEDILLYEEFWVRDDYFDQFQKEKVLPYLQHSDVYGKEVHFIDNVNTSERFYKDRYIKHYFDVQIKQGFAKKIRILDLYKNSLVGDKLKYEMVASFIGINQTKEKNEIFKIFHDDFRPSPEFFLMWNIKRVYSLKYGFFTSKRIECDEPNIFQIINDISISTRKSWELFIESHNKMIDIYRDNFDDIVKLFNSIIVNCRFLEKILFIPYKYRSLFTLFELLDLVRSGKATSWKELINLYDTQVFRNNITQEMVNMNARIKNIDETLARGFDSVIKQLRDANFTLSSWQIQFNKLQNSIDTNLKSIKNNTFITMWNTL